MIICIDVGNTNIKYAIFDGDALKFSFRVATDLKRTSDEYGSQLIGMLEFNGLRADDITGGIFSSVVPSLDYTIEHMLKMYLKIDPLQLAPGLNRVLRCTSIMQGKWARIVSSTTSLPFTSTEGESP